VGRRDGQWAVLIGSQGHQPSSPRAPDRKRGKRGGHTSPDGPRARAAGASCTQVTVLTRRCGGQRWGNASHSSNDHALWRYESTVGVRSTSAYCLGWCLVGMRMQQAVHASSSLSSGAFPLWAHSKRHLRAKTSDGTVAAIWWVSASSQRCPAARPGADRGHPRILTVHRHPAQPPVRRDRRHPYQQLQALCRWLVDEEG
jgi:hypothetical protein